MAEVVADASQPIAEEKPSISENVQTLGTQNETNGSSKRGGEEEVEMEEDKSKDEFLKKPKVEDEPKQEAEVEMEEESNYEILKKPKVEDEPKQEAEVEMEEEKSKDEILKKPEVEEEKKQEAEVEMDEEESKDEILKKPKVEDEPKQEEEVEMEEEKPVSVKLGPKVFESGEGMFNYFFKFLHYWPSNIDINKYEYMVLLELLKKGHADPDTKIGAGIQAFQVRHHPMWKSRCFFLVRVDGTSDDFSFRKCVDQILPLPENMRVPSANRNKKSNDGKKKMGGHQKGGGGGGRGGRGRGGRGGFKK